MLQENDPQNANIVIPENKNKEYKKASSAWDKFQDGYKIPIQSRPAKTEKPNTETNPANTEKIEIKPLPERELQLPNPTETPQNVQTPVNTDKPQSKNDLAWVHNNRQNKIIDLISKELKDGKLSSGDKLTKTDLLGQSQRVKPKDVAELNKVLQKVV